MLLYVIYAEPLLLLLEKSLRGLVFTAQNQQVQVSYFRQVTEAFCDDVNLFITHHDDFIAVEEAVIKFEKASGAILSRNKKCLVLGIGSWRNKKSWGLDYLQPVKEIKIFGIWFMNRYKQMLSTNWSNRIEKLRRTICSWTGRYFDNIKQKIEVVNCFALSRIFYVAALLPITKSALQDINKIVGNFLWNKSWKLLRVAREEIVNSEAKGGLALLDTESM